MHVYKNRIYHIIAEAGNGTKYNNSIGSIIL